MIKLTDLTNQKFGKWTVIKFNHRDKNSNAYWLVRCDCGTEKTVIGDSLKNGRSKSCGCQYIKSFLDITGKSFGRLIVIGLSHRNKNNDLYWNVRCQCGTEKTVLGNSLKNGSIQSCGCLVKEKIKKLRYKHGMSRSATYLAWRGMKSRCLNPKHRAYHRYGRKGVIICDEWINSFESFYNDMGEKPKGLTLDRINGNKGYFKENCRWATYKQQARNMKCNRIIEYKGERKTLAEYAEKFGLNPTTLLYRIKANWPIEKALTKPSQCKIKKKK